MKTTTKPKRTLPPPAKIWRLQGSAKHPTSGRQPFFGGISTTGKQTAADAKRLFKAEVKKTGQKVTGFKFDKVEVVK